jgi:hypothetical protein
MSPSRSVTRLSLQLTGAFEADILVTLLLKQWNHPFADDTEFRQTLLEAASEVLRASLRQERLFDEISPEKVNLVAAIWYAEATTLSADQSISSEERALRELWLESLKRSIPSCFCDPDLLP